MVNRALRAKKENKGCRVLQGSLVLMVRLVLWACPAGKGKMVRTAIRGLLVPLALMAPWGHEACKVTTVRTGS